MTEMLFKAMRSPQERAQLYSLFQDAVLHCERCGLCRTRKNVVVGEGSLTNRIMFVGEGPGEVEDDTGRPFVGPAGQLLTRILEAAGFKREEVYITNIVKCRPPGNRVPEIEEVLRCQGWLEAQIALLRPQIIVALGTNQYGEKDMTPVEEYYETLISIYGNEIPIFCITPFVQKYLVSGTMLGAVKG